MNLRRPPPADLVVDTSAIVAILLEEPDAHRCARRLHGALGPLISAASVLELLMVMEARRGPAGVTACTELLADQRVVTVPVDDVTVREAHDAWRRFGKGRHRAALNYGDCFAYALATHAELPLLCAGDDFHRTDVLLAR